MAVIVLRSSSAVSTVYCPLKCFFHNLIGNVPFLRLAFTYAFKKASLAKVDSRTSLSSQALYIKEISVRVRFSYSALLVPKFTKKNAKSCRSRYLLSSSRSSEVRESVASSVSKYLKLIKRCGIKKGDLQKSDLLHRR